PVRPSAERSSASSAWSYRRACILRASAGTPPSPALYCAPPALSARSGSAGLSSASSQLQTKQPPDAILTPERWSTLPEFERAPSQERRATQQSGLRLGGFLRPAQGVPNIVEGSRTVKPLHAGN